MKAVMYHYVRKADPALPYFRFLHLDDFIRQLDWFQDNGGFVSKDSFESYLKTGEVPEGYLLTFDDGLIDHFRFVFPVLQERAIWGAFFVCSAPLKKRQLLGVHGVHWLLGKYGPEEAVKIIECVTGDYLYNILPQTIYPEQMSGYAEKAVKYLFNYHLDYDQSRKMLFRLFTYLNVDEDSIWRGCYLDERQIDEMWTKGMGIYAHSDTHKVFSNCSVGESFHQIKFSVDLMNKYNDWEGAKGFCFPYGMRGTYNDMHIQQLKKLNVNFCFSVESQDVTRTSNLHCLPRYNCNEWPHGQSTIGK